MARKKASHRLEAAARARAARHQSQPTPVHVPVEIIEISDDSDIEDVEMSGSQARMETLWENEAWDDNEEEVSEVEGDEEIIAYWERAAAAEQQVLDKVDWKDKGMKLSLSAKGWEKAEESLKCRGVYTGESIWNKQTLAKKARDKIQNDEVLRSRSEIGTTITDLAKVNLQCSCVRSLAYQAHIPQLHGIAQLSSRGPHQINCCHVHCSRSSKPSSTFGPKHPSRLHYLRLLDCTRNPRMKMALSSMDMRPISMRRMVGVTVIMKRK